MELLNDQSIYIAKRQNNSRRSFLIVNGKQAKHIPTSPVDALEYFKKLGSLADEIHDEKVLVIGFAETATAIGVAVAVEVGANSFYIQTTRESLCNNLKIVDFKEEHSHAVAQSLYSSLSQQELSTYKTMVFVEDEVTTGRTIVNVINSLKENKIISFDTTIFILSLINNAAESKSISKMGIKQKYLSSFKDIDFYSIADSYNSFKTDEMMKDCGLEPIVYEIKGLLDPRTGVNPSLYHEKCLSLADDVIKCMGLNFAGKNVLTIGTEEFMYPSIIVGAAIENSGAEVSTCATTRSPIAVSDNANYPLQKRYRLNSFYDPSRTTYIYNIKKYDYVIIVTESGIHKEGLKTLINALYSCGNENIFLVKWV